MAGHWYTRLGVPCYEVPKKDGGKRPTTISDARKLQLVPSVTTVIGCIAKPGLERWKQLQILDIAAEHMHLKSKDNWKDMILGISREKGEKIMGRGTEIHNKLEQVFTTGIVDESDPDFKILDPVVRDIERRFQVANWKPEESFAAKEGYGGKLDLSSENVIIDFKTKESDKLDASIVNDDYLMQLAAYSNGLKRDVPWNNHYRCFNLFISTKTPGLFYWHEWKSEELERGWNMFKYILEYWKIKNFYDPSFEKKDNLDEDV
jgi:hypothetical protein